VSDFEVEMRLLRESHKLECLPEIYDATDNADGRIQSHSGFIFPPFIIMERGVTLQEWLRVPRAFMAVMHMFHDLASQLVVLHGAGYVHRDLKPDNIIWMLQTQVWKLLDFGIAASAGVPPRPASTPSVCCAAYHAGAARK
jgi:serine/threonine protein kinase